MSKQSGVNRTAESIGASLGKLQARYDAWMAQRGVLATELQNYMSVARHMLDTLGHTAEVAATQAQAVVATAHTARKRVISEAHKQTISDAAKKRWAAKKGVVVAVAATEKKQMKKKRNVS